MPALHLDAMLLPRTSLPFYDAAEPLRHRAPVCDDEGRPLSDFMVIIPGLKHKPPRLISKAVGDMQLALSRFSHAVVFAEFNLKLNLLWVSIRPIPRLRFAIVGAIQETVPEAKLVSHP
jgi:hypothetical protein